MQTRRDDQGRYKFSKLDIFLCLFFILFWILPLIVTNFTRKTLPFIPQFVSTLSSTSNLFTKANNIWPMPYIQVLPRASATWITLPEEDYFPMQTFGYRTRLFEALYLADRDTQKSLDIQKELAQWVAIKYQVLHQGTPIQSVRFVAGLQRADPSHTFAGHWKKPPYETLNKKDTYELSRHEVGR